MYSRTDYREWRKAEVGHSVKQGKNKLLNWKAGKLKTEAEQNCCLFKQLPDVSKWLEKPVCTLWFDEQRPSSPAALQLFLEKSKKCASLETFHLCFCHKDPGQKGHLLGSLHIDMHKGDKGQHDCFFLGRCCSQELRMGSSFAVFIGEQWEVHGLQLDQK